MRFKELLKRDLSKDLKTLRWLRDKMKPHRPAVAYLTISNAAEAFLEVWTAILCKVVVDAAVDGNSEVLFRNISYLLFTLAGPIVLNFIYQVLEEKISNDLRISFQNTALQHYFMARYEKNTDYHSEEILNRMFSDTSIVSEGIVDVIPTIIYFIVQFMAAFGALLYLEPKFTLVFMLASVVLGAVLHSLRDIFKGLHKGVQNSEDLLRSFLQDVLSNTLIIRIFGAYESILDKTGEHQKEYYKARMKRTIYNRAAGSGLTVVFTLGYWAAMLWGCWGIFVSKITYGTLMAMMKLVGQIQLPMTGMSSLTTEMFKIAASAERIMELEDSEGKVKYPTVSHADRKASYDSFEEISIQDVSFSYDDFVVLDHVNMSVKKGDIVSFTGLSGGGKTTLFLLLLQIYQPTEGKIAYLSRDGAEMDELSIRSMLAYVPQENQLFTGTICDNVTLFEQNPSEEKVKEALRIACADQFVEELPQGIHSELKEKGHGLSEGQMQRLSIARAIYSEAPILLLDEATSALDTDTEEKFLSNIVGLKNRTCLMVTHRQKALEYCNRHFEMDNGSFKEVRK